MSEGTTGTTGGGHGAEPVLPPSELPSFPENDPRLQPPARKLRVVAVMVGLFFVVSLLATVGLATTYSLGGQPQLEGAFLGLALVSLGAGFIAWAKYLMPRGPFVEDRHYEDREDIPSSPEDRQAFIGAFGRGAVIMGRRPLLMALLGAAGAAFTAVLIFPLRSLGPQPKETLFQTNWRHGLRLVQVDGRPVNVTDLEVGSYATVFPEGFENDPQSQEVDQVILIHVASEPLATRQGPKSWSPQGYLAFSKVCTHAGCPVSLYERERQQLLCPCHQSLFNILMGAFPVFGPAPRPLPQLAIYADSAGDLRARHDFLEPIGPGFWERGAFPRGGYRS